MTELRGCPVVVRAAVPNDILLAARVGAEAFRAEAFANWLFDLARPAVRAQLAREFAHVLMRKWKAGDTVRVALAEDEIVGVALVHVPGQPARTPRWKRVWAAFPRVVGLLAVARWIRWRRAVPTLKAMQPPKDLPRPHATLAGLAVAPSHQGMGIARLLLDAVHAGVDAEAGLAGTYLFTGDVRNRDIYTRFGYRLVRETRGGAGFTVYHMFRPRGACGRGAEGPVAG